MVVLATSFSLAGTIDPVVSESRHVEYGKKFVHVVKIKGVCHCKKREAAHDFHASAVVISPKWIVTAAHVVSSSDEVRIVIGEREYKISRIKIHEDFKEDKVGYNDIALGESEEDFGMDFYPELYSDRDEAGKVVSMSGYGMTGTFRTGAVKSTETKLAGSNIVERIERNCLVCTNVGGVKTELEFMIASGDSGGGLFLDGKLAGINSFVMADDGKPNSDYGDECAHTRVSSYVDWIKSNTGEK